MRIICEYPPGSLRNAIGTDNLTVLAKSLKNMPGVGKSFLVFASLPSSPGSAAFEMFPDYVVSSVESENLALINTMLADPPMAALAF